jgi:hypothetical protein
MRWSLGDFMAPVVLQHESVKALGLAHAAREPILDAKGRAAGIDGLSWLILGIRRPCESIAI